MKTGIAAANGAIERTKPHRRPPTKVYVLFPRYGSFSVKTIDYQGTELSVAATSVRQAYALAHKNIWINPEHTHPTGIIAIYRRATGFTLWCGCSGHDVTGGQPRHGAGIRALRAEIDAHHCDGQTKRTEMTTTDPINPGEKPARTARPAPIYARARETDTDVDSLRARLERHMSEPSAPRTLSGAFSGGGNLSATITAIPPTQEAHP